jgi:hypothetical protein
MTTEINKYKQKLQESYDIFRSQFDWCDTKFEFLASEVFYLTTYDSEMDEWLSVKPWKCAR